MALWSKSSKTSDAVDELRKEYTDALRGSAVQGIYNGPIHPPWHTESKNPVESEGMRLRMIMMRLHIGEGQMHPYQHLSTALAGDKVFVFIAHNDEAVVFEDERNNFPSDSLIAQLRLIA
jgi:hypothetical protein